MAGGNAPFPPPRTKPFLADDCPGGAWKAPLFPVALALTGGVILDRLVQVPFLFSLLSALAMALAWGIAGLGRQKGLALLYLWGGLFALGSAFHHWSREMIAPDHISHFASETPRLVFLRGLLREPPLVPRRPAHDPLRAFPQPETTRLLLQVGHLRFETEWRPVSGLVEVRVSGRMQMLHVDDELEMVGLLALPRGPSNPGESDRASVLGDQGVRAVLTVRDSHEAVTLLKSHGPRFLKGWLAGLASWGKEVLDRSLPEESARLARALLLGDTSAMTGDDWDKYFTTGVVHVLAISGQHLVVLGGFIWLLLRPLGVRRRRGALVVAGLLMGYALLVGARAPVMRAAWMVSALCGGLILRRPVSLANSLALAWVLVIAWNPSDIFQAGCLLSFLAVAVLFWGVGPWRKQQADPLARLEEENRPLWWQGLHRLGRFVAWSYVVNLAVWLAIAPLVASRFNLVTPVAILIGPPMVLLTSIALLAGFGLLLLAAVVGPLAQVCAWLCAACLTLCDLLVGLGQHLPGAYWYVADVPGWWIWTFYIFFMILLTLDLLRRWWLFHLLGALGWLALGLVMGLWPALPRDFRCTFLAVGHGGCTVIETPTGQTFLYDAGAMAGPEVTRRFIAPFLWQRGLRRIDELFLSHADIDHFNGVPALSRRFAIGQVTCTPTFANRALAGVAMTLEAFRKHHVPVRVVKAGDYLVSGDVGFRVLHPPAEWKAGNENARSLVLLVQHGGRAILLTGDLENPGLAQVLSLPAEKIDVLMAPHHGSRAANTPELAAWARPLLVVSSQEKPRDPGPGHDPYRSRGARFLGTWLHGAITIRICQGRLSLETFRSRQQWELD